ncbi:rho GTPase-activating protein 24-like [Solea senegalensis]|uniref:Rho GTPase-activating protein 24-like n=1 Tax=Solea senegalensis TaxID=28829 RepID=A0AAV6SKL7_SOLSE|nr:rho GTPase-activating protein 22-like [Solea senegalensis]KAG7516901.1 rho GTPase-activating protein 24-like [Solea senegalensis]
MGLSCFKSWKNDSTGHKGNRDVLASPGSYFFLSNSAGQGDEWLKSLNKGVWIPFTGVFGQSLEETVLYERRYGMRLVPLVVEQCVTFIRERGLHEVGLFRQPGQASLVKELQEAFDSGERPSFDSSTDIHTVASLLKLYLRLLPEPLVPYSCYQDFLLCGQRLRSDRARGLEELRILLHELPVANFNLLNFICQFLDEVQSYSGSNKMSDQNLATVFGPNILRAKAQDPQSIMGGAALVHVLMLELIRGHESLFAKVSPPASDRPPGGRRASPSALRQPHLHSSPCLRQLSMPLIAERSRDPGRSASDARTNSCAYSSAANSESSWAQKRLLGHRYTSSHPENCFYPLPSLNQSPQNHGDRLDYHQRRAGEGSSSSHVQASSSSLQLQDSSTSRLMVTGWTKVWPGPAEADAGFWTSAAAEDEGAEPESASGGSSDAQEDSATSAYDNLDGAPSRQRTEDGDNEDDEDNHSVGHVGSGEEEAELGEAGKTRDSSSSWSSCEGLPLDERIDVVEPVGSPQKPERLASSREAEEENNGNHERIITDDDDDDDSIHHPNSPASVICDSPLSTGSSEVFLPSGPADLHGPESLPQSADAHSLLGKLQQQMAQQKSEYQARIQRLERCNDVLKRQVALLRVSLEQQRRSQSVAELKIRNMERAKADADLQNDTLQREMEMFFQMYGEIKRKGGDGARGSL